MLAKSSVVPTSPSLVSCSRNDLCWKMPESMVVGLSGRSVRSNSHRRNDGVHRDRNLICVVRCHRQRFVDVVDTDERIFRVSRNPDNIFAGVFQWRRPWVRVDVAGECDAHRTERETDPSQDE